MSPRPILAVVSLLFVAAAVLLIFLITLAGAVNGDPVDQWYFLQADTSSIPGAPPVARWTLWNYCAVDANGRNIIAFVTPAYPLDPPSNFGTETKLNAAFVSTNKFYYMTRFMFAFWIIALFFAVCSLFLGLFALCSRIGSYLSGVLCYVAFFFQTLVAALMTAAYVEGRDAFRASSQSASVGTTAFAFVWAASACLLIAAVLFGIAGSMSRHYHGTTTSRFSRKRSTRSRGSFLDERAVA